MNWEPALEAALLKAASIESFPSIASLTDLTLLDHAASETDVKKLVTTALDKYVAAICVFPQHLSWVSENFILSKANDRPALATVVNFPSGNDSQDAVLESIRDAITLHKAQEIDYVFPYQLYFAGDVKKALSNCASAYQQTKQYGAMFKVILETGAFQSLDMVYQLSLDIIENGCDFLKTSTGKIAIGATLPAAFAILKAITDTKTACGIKISGGIKTEQQAYQYMRLAQSMTELKLNKHWFRLGTSKMVA